MSQTATLSNNTTKNLPHSHYWEDKLNLSKCYNEDEPKNIVINIIDYVDIEDSKEYTTLCSILPMTLQDLQKPIPSSKSQVISNYFAYLISNNKNNDFSNKVIESVEAIKSLVKDIICSTNEKAQMENFSCEQNYCDAV